MAQIGSLQLGNPRRCGRSKASTRAPKSIILCDRSTAFAIARLSSRGCEPTAQSLHHSCCCEWHRAAPSLRRRHLTVAVTGEMLLRGTARRAVAAASRRHLTVAVTGASGRAGSYITEELLKRGHDVRALVRGCETNKEKAAPARALPGADPVA